MLNWKKLLSPTNVVLLMLLGTMVLAVGYYVASSWGR